MKRIILAGILVLLLCPMAHAGATEDNDLRITIEPAHVWRTSATDHHLLIQNDVNNFPSNTKEFSDINEPGQYGVQFDVVWQLSDAFALEFAGLWTDTVSSSGVFFDPSLSRPSSGTDAAYDQNPGNDFNTGNSSGVYALDYSFESRLLGAELNLISNWGLDTSWFHYYLGLRYLHYYERVGTAAYDDENDYLRTDDDTDLVDIGTWNNLIGPQIGADLRVEPVEWLTIGADAWIGYFLNSATVSREFESLDLPAQRRDDVTCDSRGTLGMGLSPRASVQILDNVALTLGGDLVWLGGVSLAGAYYSSIADLDSTTLHADGSVLFLGAHGGIVITF